MIPRSGHGRRPLVRAAAVVALLSSVGHGGRPDEPGPAFAWRQDGGWNSLALPTDTTAPDLADVATSRRMTTTSSAGAGSEVRWVEAGAGVQIAHLEIGRPGGWTGEAILARIDPARSSLSLTRATRRGGTRGDWSVDERSPDAVAALNAGQFEGGRAWGWLVVDGLELQPPGTGPLSMALVVERSGAVRLVPWGQIPRVRYGGEVRQAFQSYPVLLRSGRPPEALRQPGRGVDLHHRDIRLAVGSLADGRLLLALTRYADVAGVSLPFGPTVPEMAALMADLGAVDAMLLDGGLSAQLALETSSGIVETWKGGRRVPLALEVRPTNGG